jgi:hypothetical protein
MHGPLNVQFSNKLYGLPCPFGRGGKEALKSLLGIVHQTQFLLLVIYIISCRFLLIFTPKY